MIYSVVLLSVVQQSESVVCVFIYVYGAGNGSPLQYSCLENPVKRGAWWASVHGVAQNRTRLRQLSTHACVGEGNGNPLQCSCLENPRDGGAWWAAVYGVVWSRTRLELLSSSSSMYIYMCVCVLFLYGLLQDFLFLFVFIVIQMIYNVVSFRFTAK